MKRANIIYCVAFVLVCCICPVLMLAGKGDENKTKHALAQFPPLITEGQINTSFPQGFDDYFADHIPYRNWLITSYHQMLGVLTGDIADEQVLLGKDGWLFFNETLDDYMSIHQLTDRQISQLARCFKLQSDYIAAQGGSFMVAIAPNKNSIYAKYMPSRFGRPQMELRNLYRLQAALAAEGVEYVDLQRDLLAQKKSEQLLYYTDDTHWNDQGAYIAYKSILSATGLDIQPIDGGDTYWQGSARGDLYDMAFPAGLQNQQTVVVRGKLDYSYSRKPRSLEDMTIHTTAQGSHTLLMHRDSFANALIPFLSGHFAQAYYERETPFRYLRAVEIQPDVMLWEVAERNIPLLLESAPVMPAIEVDAEVAADCLALHDGWIRMFTEQKHGLTHIYGYVHPDAMADGQRLLMKAGDKYYEPFPILESAIAKMATEEWGADVKHCGFSIWVDEIEANATIVRAIDAERRQQ